MCICGVVSREGTKRVSSEFNVFFHALLALFVKTIVDMCILVSNDIDATVNFVDRYYSHEIFMDVMWLSRLSEEYPTLFLKLLCFYHFGAIFSLDTLFLLIWSIIKLTFY